MIKTYFHLFRVMIQTSPTYWSKLLMLNSNDTNTSFAFFLGGIKITNQSNPLIPANRNLKTSYFYMLNSMRTFALFVLLFINKHWLHAGVKNANEKVKMEDLIKMALQWLVMAWGSHFLILNIVAFTITTAIITI